MVVSLGHAGRKPPFYFSSVPRSSFQSRGIDHFHVPNRQNPPISNNRHCEKPTQKPSTMNSKITDASIYLHAFDMVANGKPKRAGDEAVLGRKGIINERC